jgi:hypothetical protein
VDLLNTSGLEGWRSRDQAIGMHQERRLDRFTGWSRLRRNRGRRSGWRSPL